MRFPAGSSYRLSFDVTIALADHASALLTLGGDGLWASPANAIGEFLGREPAAIAPGTKTLCLAVGVEGADVGQGVEATYSRLRVRRFVSPDPSVELAGLEEECPSR